MTMNTLVVINGMTVRRANVIATRTGSAAIGVIKAQMIDLLKAKLQNGVAHFIYLKKDGTIRMFARCYNIDSSVHLESYWISLFCKW